MEAVALSVAKPSMLSLPFPPPGQVVKPQRLIAIVGRPSLPRSAEYLAEAAYLVRQVMPEARFKLALGRGAGPQLDDRLTALALSGCLELAGTPDPAAFQALASEADVLVVESLPPRLRPEMLLRLPPRLRLVVSRQVDQRYVPYQAAQVNVWDPRRMADAIVYQLGAGQAWKSPSRGVSSMA